MMVRSTEKLRRVSPSVMPLILAITQKPLSFIHIPIFDPSHLDEQRPDYIVVLPWNLREEITRQLAHTREWGARLVFPLPTLEVIG